MSTLHFHPLTIADIREETPECVSISLNIPDSLKSLYQFQAGQYITFKTQIDGQEIRRSYSLCSSPLEADFRVAVKQVKNGLFSTFACQVLKPGDALEVMPPTGNFTLKPEPQSKRHYLAFAAGSGITPVISLIKTLLESEPESRFTLIYGNRQLQSIIFREELESLKNKYIHRLQIIHVLSRERLESELNYGRIDHDKCRQLFDGLLSINQIDHYFLCGPEEMILQIKAYLQEKGIDQKKIHFELFTTGSAQKMAAASKATREELSGEVSTVTIKVDDRTYDIQLARNGESILDAALKSGADLPYACKGGVCCTCRAKVVSGEVAMDVNYALEPDEVENGFVLTCQSHPTSEHVFIDYDVR